VVARTFGDAQAGSVFAFRSQLRQLLSKKDYDLVLISAPPHSLLKLAAWLRRKMDNRGRLIVDLRDPCTVSNAFMARAGSIGSRALRAAERTAIHAADEVWVVSPGMHRRYRKKYPSAASKFVIVENGFVRYGSLPPMQEEVQSFCEESHSSGRVVLGYFGSGYYGRRRENGKRLNVLWHLAERSGLFVASGALLIQGAIRGRLPTLPIPSLRLPAVNNALARSNMHAVDVGVFVFESRADADLVLGGKLYDYLAAGILVWVIAPPNALSLREFARRHHDKVVFSNVENWNELLAGFQRLLQCVRQHRPPESTHNREDRTLRSYERSRIVRQALQRHTQPSAQ
jgi:hypothetical protein